MVKLRTGIVVAIHLALVVVANVTAFELRFGGNTPIWALNLQIQTLPWLVAIRGVLFVPFGVYRCLWRYAGIWDLRNILASVGLSSAAFYVFTVFSGDRAGYPRSILVIDALLLAFFVGGLRCAVRL